MAWIFLLIAGLLESAWAIGLKHSEGWTKPIPSIITVILMIASFYFLSLALKEIPIGTAYAVWTGIGIVGTAAYGMIFIGESTEVLRIVCIVLIVAGIAGLKILSN